MTNIHFVLFDGVRFDADPADHNGRSFRRNLAAAIKEAATRETLGEAFQRLVVYLHPEDGDPIDVDFCFEDAPLDPPQVNGLTQRTSAIIAGLSNPAALLDRHKSVVIVPTFRFATRFGVWQQDEQSRTEQRVLRFASYRSLGEHFVDVLFDGPAAHFRFADYRDEVNGRRVRELARGMELAATPA